MGSFSYTCAVSNLPIAAGDPVRYYLLTENPYEDSRACTSHDLWFPRTFPIKAKYNDYGSVEDVQEGPLKDVWLEGLQKDLVERGWGDNSCHDVPVSKSMNFDQLLEAVVEGRIRVRRGVSFEATNDMPELTTEDKKRRKELLPGLNRKIPEGVPTRKRVEKALQKAGLPLYGGDGSPGGFMVDKTGYGEVRVRFQSWGEEFGKDAAWLEKTLPHLTEYATMISAGSGSYAHSADLTVRPKPGTKDYHGRRREKNSRSLLVEHAMIREDVWQALLSMQVETWNSKGRINVGVDAYREGIKQLYEEWFKGFNESKERWEHLDKTDDATLRSMRSDLRFLMMMKFEHNMDVPGAWILKDSIPFTVGLGVTWKLLVKKAPLSQGVLDTVAEFAFVHSVLHPIRYWWRPSYSIGPQFGEWDEHERVQKVLLDLTKKIAAKERKERQ